MLPDSTTHSKKGRGVSHDTPDTSRRRKKKKNDEKRKTKKRRSSPHPSSSRSSSPSSSSSSSSDDSQSPKSSTDNKLDPTLMNIKEKIIPLFSLINDREKLIQELFRSIRGKHLATLLPEYLKDMPIEELKSRCLAQLEIMSAKRVENILRGEPTESSSDTEQDIEKEETDQRTWEMATALPDSTSHTPTEDTRSEGERIPVTSEVTAPGDAAQVRGEDENVSPCDRLSIHEEAAEWESEGDEENESSEAGAAPATEPAGTSGRGARPGEDECKAKMEIFELEMRARAIRAMLKAQELKERRSRHRKETGKAK